MTSHANSPQLGIRNNLAQFSLLVLVNALVGAMVGLERTLLPGLAEQEFALAAKSAVLSFIVVFGVAKALTNYLAGRWSDRFGRKHILVGGWIAALPVPFLLMWAPTWGWVLAANALLGVSQGLTWSTTVIMKIDLAGPNRRGLAMGLNEFAGYLAVAGSALATGLIASSYGLRPAPFYLGVVYAVVGLGLSLWAVKETRGHASHEAKPPIAEISATAQPIALTPGQIFWKTTLGDRNLSSISQAGLVNNLNDGMAWGLFPLVFASAGMNLAEVGMLAALYPASWGVAQLATGAWSDRVGRKWLIAGGMVVQAVGIVVTMFGKDFRWFASGALLLGVGTAMVYPTLLAAIGDVAHPSWRASAVGVYRLWRDLGYAVGALIAGFLADWLGIPVAMLAVAALTFASGVVVALRMSETLRRPSGNNSAEPAVECCSLVDLQSRSDQFIVDVRSAEDYQIGHVTGAVHIPLAELPGRLDELPKDRPIVTVCGKGGGRSEQAAILLRSVGFASVRSLCGGTAAWMASPKAAGLPASAKGGVAGDAQMAD